MRRSALIVAGLLVGLLGVARPGAALVVDEFVDEPQPAAQPDGSSGGTSTAGDAGDTPDLGDPVLSYDPFDGKYPALVCMECRDPISNNVDFGNFAWNAVWGPNRTIGLWDDYAIGGMLKVVNSQGQYVLVWFSDYLHMFGYPTNTMLINVRIPNGQVLIYAVLQVGAELPVGEQAGDPWEPEPGDGGADGEDDPDTGDDSDYGYEPPETDPPRGTVEILDPDDNGEYPDWFEEL